MSWLINANALHIPLADQSVHMCVTSPPYWGLRSYSGTGQWVGGDPECDHAVREDPHLESSTLQGGKMTVGHQQEGYKDYCRRCGAIRVDNQLGLERTPEEYVANMVAVFREVWRVLRDDGTCWLNLGDSYAGGGYTNSSGGPSDKQSSNRGAWFEPREVDTGLKPKDLVGIPWRVAFALQADGWYLRSDIIWCLSGGAYVYAKTQKGVLPTMVRDLYRLDPASVQLWNGEKWTRLLGMSKSKRRGDELELVLRSGERISCTPTHKFPTQRGLVDAGGLTIGDVIQTCQLPDVESPRDCAIDEDAAWLAGLYIAEGSRSGDSIQIAGHSKETERWERVCKIAAKYGGSCTRTIDGNMMNIRVYGKVLNAIIDELVTGSIAKDKGFSPSVWKYSNKFISSMLDGYLAGDGHYDLDNNRWRLGFTRNYNLERDLRTACARLGYLITLKLSTTLYNGKDIPTFRGEIRMVRSGHHNEKNTGEIVEIRKSRCREVYDLGVEDDPHLFSLASGVLTHNSKPNPMPESVTDRPTKAHEYIFLLSKSQRYYYDAEAVRENGGGGGLFNRHSKDNKDRNDNGREDKSPAIFRNRRTVWTIATAPYSGAHFATYPPALVEPCIKAGTSERGVCPKCGKPWERVVEKEFIASSAGRNKISDASWNNGWEGVPRGINKVSTTGWRPTCTCDAGDPIPATVLDPFVGSGTTLLVARQLGRRGVGLDLSYSYLHEQARKRLGLDALDAWTKGIAVSDDGYHDLPMFTEAL